jgi:cell division protein FtsW (lipid II flippase)
MRSLLIAARQTMEQTASSTGSSTPRQLEFLPVEHTDFIFSVKGDDFSIVGIGISLLILLLVTRFIHRRRSLKRRNHKLD